jgi:hypothetical protein
VFERVFKEFGLPAAIRADDDVPFASPNVRRPEQAVRVVAEPGHLASVELDAELPEGSPVTVLALEGDETFETDTETEKMLLEAMAQCRSGRVTPLKDLLGEMRSRE